jgi:hypothetical protein
VDRGTLRWICVVTGLVLAALWLVTVLTSGTVLDWVPPSAVVALGAALAL